MLRSDAYLGHKKGHFGGADLAKNGGFCIRPLNALSGVLQALTILEVEVGQSALVVEEEMAVVVLQQWGWLTKKSTQ